LVLQGLPPFRDHLVFRSPFLREDFFDFLMHGMPASEAVNGTLHIEETR